MIDNSDIERFIKQIPSAPIVVMEVLEEIKKDDLIRAAKVAAKDPALVWYLRGVVNRPGFGLRENVSDVHQIFSTLGILKAKQVIDSYLISILAPKEWAFFEITQEDIQGFQSDCIIYWNKILETKGCNDPDVAVAAVLMPAAIIVCEFLFRAKREEIELITSVKYINYDTLLKKLTGMSFFDLLGVVCQKWELPHKSARILKASSGTHTDVCDKEELIFAKYLHLLFFYLLAKPNLSKAGLTQFIEYNPSFAEEILDEFIEIVGVPE